MDKVKHMDIPIIIFIYKRPDQLSFLLNQISKVKPKEIFVFSDGPASNIEKEQVEKCRKLIDNINWSAAVHRHYSEENIGLSNSIINGLNFVFSIRDKAIILEEDCIPEISFFYFCKNMLLKYESDDRIMQISGTNLIANEIDDKKIQCFASKFSLPNWGWATWNRAWRKFNPNYDTYSKNLIKTPFPDNVPTIWDLVFRSLFMGNRDSWDIQWMIDIWNNNGYTFIPSKNLISNIGNSKEASYTPNISSFIKLPTSAINEMELNHDFTLQFESSIEEKVTEMLEEFVSFNRENNKLSITRQCINYLLPKNIQIQAKNLEELRTLIMPLHSQTILPRSFFEKCIEDLPKIKKIREGEWVQFGSWKGGCTLFFKTLMRDLDINNNLYIYDTFSTIPIENLKHSRDKEFIKFFQINGEIKNYKIDIEILLAKFNLNNGVNFIQENILDINLGTMPKKISFACIDVDFYEPTLHSLQLVYPNLIIGGVILVDDYYTNLLNCREAVDYFLETYIQQEQVKIEPFNDFTIKITRLK